MKGLIVRTTGEVEEKDFGEPLYKTVGEEVGGWIEVTGTVLHNDEPALRMIVNEEGIPMDLAYNPYASLLHGTKILGNAVIMREGMTEDGPDIVGLEDGDAEKVEAFLVGCVETIKGAFGWGCD